MKDHNKPSCEQLIDIFPDPFVIIDQNYIITAANNAYRRHYQINSDDLIGRRCHEVSHHSTEPCSKHGGLCPLEEVFASGQQTRVMHIHYDSQGNEEYVQLQAVPIMDNAGKVMFMGEYIQTVNMQETEHNLLIGRSPVYLHMLSLLQRVAPTNSTVLLLGESGSEKEKVAEYIHHYSKRANAPFVLIDCSTLSENLIESELFGHENGADQRKNGLFEAANGGTLFIDELCELPLTLQTKLLRVLESGTIRRLGSNEYIKVDVRIIAASNKNIQPMVANKEFRQDLYYRLSAFPINVPPLRDRKDDIVPLAEHFLRQIPEGDNHLPLSTDIIETLLGYPYPGNVRELRNIIERAAIFAGDDALRPKHIVFEDELNNKTGKLGINNLAPPPPLIRRRNRLKHEDIITALSEAKGHRAKAAHMLGISERTLYRHIQKLRQSEHA